ncbi:MAG: hypothetical protein JWP35_1542 [Caulobacter sp.]|nr:hypothetical protein [Caulobacter sp.]
MNAPLAITLDDEHRAQLEALAAERSMSAADLAAKAVADFVEEDAAWVAAVKEGLASLDRGEGRSLEEVDADMRAYITRRMREVEEKA